MQLELLPIHLVATAVLQALLVRLKQSAAAEAATLTVIKAEQAALAAAVVFVQLLVQPSVARGHQAKEMLAALVLRRQVTQIRTHAEAAAVEQAKQGFCQTAQQQAHKVTAAMGSANQTTRSLAHLVYLLAEAERIQTAELLRMLALILQEAPAAEAMAGGM